jgi:hypothetical protein
MIITVLFICIEIVSLPVYLDPTKNSINREFGGTTTYPTSESESVPTTSEPTTSEPTTSEPTTSEPTTYPTTSEPTETVTICENYPPEVNITGIEDDKTYSGTITIEVTVTGAYDIDEATINIDGGDIDETENIDLDLAAGTWTGEYNLDTADFPDDTYKIKIMVYDVCDNVETILLEVTFDNGNGDGGELTPGFEGISTVLVFGAIVAVFWRRQNRK